MKKNIILCGMPGSGKTTVSKELASHLNKCHIDTDAIIEQKHGRSCRQICREDGEVHFRRLEKEVITALQETENAIISLGGGCLQETESQQNIKSTGTVIYLKCDPNVLIDRKIHNDNPAYASTADEYGSLIEKRTPIFQSIQDVTIDVTDLSVKEIILRIMELTDGE